MRAPLGFAGIDVVLDRSLGLKWEQVKFPRSKKKRIRRKWMKRRKNWRSFYDGPQMLHVKPNAMRLALSFGALGREYLIVNPPAMKLLKEMTR